MAEAAIIAVAPNLGGQEAAVAGSQAVVFTATDRKLIEERGGEIDKTRTFLEALKKRPLTPEVENEQSSVKPEINLKELEGRRRDHQRMLKHSALVAHTERVEITNKLPDEYEAELPLRPEPNAAALSEPAPVKVVAAPVEKAGAAAAYQELTAEQEKLNTVKSQVKEYHLRRLFTDDEREFQRLSEQIRRESLAAVREGGRAWLDAQLTRITLGAARYKLNLLNSLEELALDDQHRKTIQWLRRTIEQLAEAA